MNDVQHGLLMSAVGELVVRMGYDLEAVECDNTGDITFATSDGAITLRVSRDKLLAMGLSSRKLRLVRNQA